MSGIYRKLSKWADGEFPDERILSIALHQGSFLVDKYNPKDKNRNNRAKNLVKQGYMKNRGTEGAIRYYSITDEGKERLKQWEEIFNTAYDDVINKRVGKDNCDSYIKCREYICKNW